MFLIWGTHLSKPVHLQPVSDNVEKVDTAPDTLQLQARLLQATHQLLPVLHPPQQCLTNPAFTTVGEQTYIPTNPNRLALSSTVPVKLCQS